jgi:rod shape-determining protein MreD
MKWRQLLQTLALFGTLAVLHYTVRPLLGWRVGIDFLAIAVLLTSVRLRPGAAAVLGFVTGLIADSLVPSTFGAGALAMTVVAYAASRLKAAFFADNVLLRASLIFTGAWTYDVIYLLAARRTPIVESLLQVLVWSPLSAALTAVAGVTVMLIFRVSLDPRAR